MQSVCFDHNAWFEGESPPGGRFHHNDSVRILSGPHAGSFGSLISVEALDPEPTYLVELASGKGDVLQADSTLDAAG
ncbi:hypothetical protein OT109_17460 [Phycisphaeraceae bacterium D3-23]